jgi:hypothetical protein
MSKRGDRTLNIDFQPAAGGGSTANSCGSDLKGYYQAIGMSANQFKTAPVVSAMMVTLIDQKEQGSTPTMRPP